MKQDIIDFYPVIKNLGELVLKFTNLFKEVKKEKNIMDFNDLEHFCLDILLEKDSTKDKPIRTKKAVEISKKYFEVLIDEYQDSNIVQELILWSVSKDSPKNRFMVGDIKQSIYKFRRAKPELFIEKYSSFSEVFNGENLKIDLYKNFRSRKCVLSSINFLFYQLMTKDVGDIVYDDKQALFVGANFIENTDNLNISIDTELHLIEQNISDEANEFLDDEIEELDKLELEAKVVGKRISELVNGEQALYVEDKNGLRVANYSDIVILVRSISKSGEIFVEELKKLNIPAFANTSEGFWNSIEVLTILSFLQIIDNPIQDIHLLSVLHSPAYFFESGELLEIRNANKKTSFYDALKTYISEDYDGEQAIKVRLFSFLSDLNRWRDIAIYTPISQLIWLIYNESAYFNYVGVMPGGLIRQANLRSLQEKAIQYETTGFKSLFHFIKYIEKLQNAEQDIGNAKILSENDNVVRIMTIHKSKGLEFPIVFVSLLGKNFNLQDERKSLILDPDLGFGPMFIDIENRIKSNTIARLAISKKLHQESLSEELRVLYVALTRAKEKLILTGVTRNMSARLKAWTTFVTQEDITLPSYYMLKARSFLDFIVPAIARHKDATILVNNMSHKSDELYNFDTSFKIIFWSHEDILSEIISTKIKNHLLFEQLTELDNTKDFSGFKDEIKRRLSFEYSFKNEISLPNRISISEIKRHSYELEQENMNITPPDDSTMIFDLPDFIQTEKSISNTHRGTVIHTVIEHIDLKVHNTTAEIKRLLDDLGKSFLTPEEIKTVPVDKILKFVNSDIAERMRKSDYIKKEESFVMNLSLFEAYGEPKYLESNNTILVQGIIDCYFEENDKIILVDYKSDYINDDNLQDIIEKYKIQLGIYKKAIEKSTQKEVSECLIYFFSLGRCINIFTHD